MRKLIDVFNSLEGNWVFDRTIEHVDLAMMETAKGRATFSRKDTTDRDTLFYEESGQLSLTNNDKQINFKRKYIYRLKGESLDIILNDGVTKGKLFQTLMFQMNEPELKGTEHISRLDKHNGKHLFQDAHNYYTEYTVEGPKTNLLIKTYYQKI